nr:GNAT family N-acetyltransferase [Motiliproteus sp. SC1-56]
MWIGETEEAVPAAQATRYLGAEFDLLVFDALDQIDPDALAATTGTLRGGGLMVLLMPPLVDLVEGAASPFRRWLAGQLHAAPEPVLWQQGETPPALPNAAPPTEPVPTPSDAAYRTEDQARAVAAILRVVQGHRRRPLVLKADRGRGKSVALAIAVWRLLQQGPRQILVTAPSRAALASFYAWLQERGLKAASGGQITYNGGELRFVAPDELLHGLPRTDLLLVDEAAALPAPMLRRMVQEYARVVFSTTVHGYEGTGRGFELRFQGELDTLAPGWSALQLAAPVRWAPGDPLERWIFRTLLLAAKPAVTLPPAQPPEAVECRLWSPAELVDNPGILSQLFALLVQAHYRTTPGDLQDLLNGDFLDTWVSIQQGCVLGAVLVAREGGFDRDLAREIWAGRRRPRGHLLPQVLAAQGGWLAAPEFRYWRVVRIAVHPAVQRGGLGTRMLAQLGASAESEGVDMLGSSFGLTADLAHFWGQAGFRPLRLGLRRDASSGCHSLMVVRPLNLEAGSLVEKIQARFVSHLPPQLGAPLQEMEAEAVVALLARLPRARMSADPQDWLDRVSFAAGQRGLEQCRPALQGLVLDLLTDARVTVEPEVALLWVQAVLQGRPWRDCRSDHPPGSRGRKAGLARLRASLMPFLRCRLPAGLTPLLAALEADPGPS